MIKRIEKNNKIFKSSEFQKDKHKFFRILQNLSSENLELYSDEENYVLCRSEKQLSTWIWTKDNFDRHLLPEIESAIDKYRLDFDTRFTCKKELYNLLKQDDYKYLGNYYFEMGYLVCYETIKPKKVDGKSALAKISDIDVLTQFAYNESRKINGKEIICLIKPQFECGKEVADKYKGIILNKEVHEEVIKNVINEFKKINYYLNQITSSPITGGNGNIEYLVYLTSENKNSKINIKDLVEETFEKLKLKE